MNKPSDIIEAAYEQVKSNPDSYVCVAIDHFARVSKADRKAAIAEVEAAVQQIAPHNSALAGAMYSAGMIASTNFWVKEHADRYLELRREFFHQLIARLRFEGR